MNEPGTKMYICGTGDDLIIEYDLSTPWDISTAIYNGNYFDPSGQDNPIDITFKPDGTKMYVMGTFNDTIYEYDLSIPWDITSATYSGKLKDVSGQVTSPYGIDSNPAGTKFYVLKYDQYIYEYDLSTPWDISTAIYNGNYFDPSSENTNIEGFSIKRDGTKMYTSDAGTDKIYEYDLSTPWDITSAIYSEKLKDVSGQVSEGTAVIIPTSSGTKMYVMGKIHNEVYQYTLSTPWDVSSASYDSKYKNVDSEEYNPTGIRFLTGQAAKPKSRGYIF